VIAFRVTDKLFFFGKEIPARWVKVRNKTTQLVSLKKFHARDKFKLHFGTKKDALVHYVINKQDIYKYRYILSTATPLSVIFRKTFSTKFITDARPKSDQSYKRSHELKISD